MNEVWKKPPISLQAYQNMVGHEVGVSSWHLVDQNRIDVYADVIEDHQFIHVDPERAKRETSFGNIPPHRCSGRWINCRNNCSAWACKGNGL